MRYMLVVLGLLGIVVSVILLQQLVGITLRKEGFQDTLEAEDRTQRIHSPSTTTSVRTNVPPEDRTQRMYSPSTTTSVRTNVPPEERMSPEVFSYNLLQSVKGPIKRLSSQLLNLNMWKERIDLAGLTPVELARRNIVG
jgi:hypothetical protein